MPLTTPPVGWTKGIRVTIAASQITITQSGVRIYLTAAALSSTFIQAMRSDGGDLRVTSDDPAATFLPRHIIHFDKVAEELILAVKLDSVISGVAKDIYLWCGNSSATEPAPRDVSGYESTYQNVLGGTNSYYGSCTLQDAPDSGTLFPSNPGFKSGKDYAGNWTPINAGIGITQGVGPLPGQNAWVLGDGNNIINLEAIDTSGNNSTRAFHMKFWARYTAYPSSNAPIFVGDFNRFLKYDSNGRLKFGDSGNPSNQGGPLNEWILLAIDRTDSGNISYWLNGSSNGNTSTTQDIENMNRMFMDRNNNGNSFDGMEICLLDVCRGTSLGVTHLALEYNSIKNYLTFASGSDETSFTTPRVLTIEGLVEGSAVSIWDDDDPDPQDLGTLLASVEALVGTTYDFPHGGLINNIVVQMIADGYEEISLPFELRDQDQTLTIIPTIEENI